MKRVSYIITTKNRAKNLNKVMENIGEYISKRDELIIVDGGSTDSTKKVVRKYRNIVNIFISERDFGEAHALNKGILLASGKYIKILTDDDYIYPAAMKKAISTMENNPSIDAIQCGGEAYVIDPKSGKEKILFYEQVFPGIKIAQDLIHVSTYCPCGLGLMFKRDLVSRVGLFDTSFRAVDLGFISRLIQTGVNLKYLNISLYKHINYPHSGENFADEIHRDEARVYLDHGLWKDLMRVDTDVLAGVLGTAKMPSGIQLVNAIKLLSFLNKIRFNLPLYLLSLGEIPHKKLAQLKHSLSQHKHRLHVPVAPPRDGKFW